MEVYIMKNNKEIKTSVLKKVGAVALGLGIVGASVLAGASLFPRTEEVFIEVPYTVVEYKDVIVEVPVETIVETVVEKEVEVLVDNGNLVLVLNYVYENGDVEFLTEDLFDDEVDKIVDRIILIEDVKAQAKSYVIDNFAKELEKQHDYDKRDVSRISIDSDDVVFVKESADFKYEDFVVDLVVEFRYDGSKETKEVSVEYYNGRIRTLTIN
jgi:hypothetical protein